MPKVLIIEDEVALTEALKIRFEKDNFEVVTAKNGEEGLKAALSEHPDIILLDIVMPWMDGLTMLHKLRQDDWGKDVPVILLTNLSDPDKIAEAMERGVHDYLVKSEWKMEDLVERVKERLR